MVYTHCTIVGPGCYSGPVAPIVSRHTSLEGLRRRSPDRHAVVDATTGEEILAPCSIEQYNRWYDHHAEWRKPRNIEEVTPALRAGLDSTKFVRHVPHDIVTHCLIED